MPNKKIRAIVADDSAFMRLLITDIITSDGRIEVIGTATDGKDAIAKVSELKPDVLVLDMNMGEFSGIYAVENLMKNHPLPILILSAVGNTGLSPIFEALKLGAVDYVNKPKRGNSKVRDIGVELIQKIVNVSYAKPKSRHKIKTKLAFKKTLKQKYDLIVIGASTGGPSAIEEIISLLPSTLNVPIVICQHMPSNFIQPFVNRLDNLTDLKVVEGAKSMLLESGMIVIAPGHTNMIVEYNKNIKKLEIGFSDEKFKEYNNPSINALMLSIAQLEKVKTIGVILTGMGKDGVNGMEAIKKTGGYTIAQNKESCIIYGMPRVAFERNVIDKVLDIKEISNKILSKL